MGEVGADNKQVLGREVGLQRLCNLSDHRVRLRADEDRHEHELIPEEVSKEGKLHLEAVLVLMSLGQVLELAVFPDQLLTQFHIYLHRSQRGDKITLGIDRCPGQQSGMARSYEKPPPVLLVFFQLVESRGGHLAGEHVPGMGNDDGHYLPFYFTRDGTGEECVQHLVYLGRQSGVKPAGSIRLAVELLYLLPAAGSKQEYEQQTCEPANDWFQISGTLVVINIVLFQEKGNNFRAELMTCPPHIHP